MGNYYDFSQMVDELQSLNTTSDELLSEIRALHEEQIEYYESVQGSFTVLNVLLVISIAIGVLFR